MSFDHLVSMSPAIGRHFAYQWPFRTSPDIDAYMQQMLPKIELTRKIARDNIHDSNDRTQFYYNRDTAYCFCLQTSKI